MSGLSRVDPGTRRARSLVLLVIFTVALPSLLLTALGAAAVENEEAAARMRIEQLYWPVVIDLAKKLGQRLDDLVDDSKAPLGELIAWGRGNREDAPALVELSRATDFAVNYFLIDPGGQPLLPAIGDEEDPREELPSSLLREMRNEEDGHGDYECLLEDEHLEDRFRCAVRFASVLQKGKDHAAEPDHVLHSFKQHGCKAYAASPLARIALEGGWPKDEVDAIHNANALLDHLRDPLAQDPPLLVELLARRASIPLADRTSSAASRARHLLLTVAERPRLLRYLSGLSHLKDGPVQLTAYGVEEWRRVLVTRSIDGYLAGFELVPSATEAFLDNSLKDRELEDALTAKVFPLQPPDWWAGAAKDQDRYHEDRIAAWSLLKRTDLAWRLYLLLPEPLSLTRSRSTLYFWALILIAGALVVGIGYTVRSVIQEARLSRLKTDFVSSVSHDLRTPLTSIRMFTETLLLGRASSREEEREFLGVIADETERLSRLTERILDFSRMEAGRKAYNFSALELGDLVKQALAACRPMIEDGSFEVKLDLAPELPKIEADHDAMIEVMINLISNAIKYSPDERQIGVCVGRRGDQLTISVSDRGIGIAKSEQRRIFEKFYRVECRRTVEVGGTGIGLSLVEHIVSAHNGYVSVESAPGEGSTFTVWLPTAPSAEAAPETAEVGTWRASSS